MKKKIAWALCLGLGCLTLAGCSGNSEPFEAKTYTPEGQVQGVQLDVEDREVEVPSPLTNRCTSSTGKTARSITRLPSPTATC